MTITQLEYVLAIVETGSFQKAAEKTFVTQPTLSQQVKKLEDQLGAVIFNRSGRRARLTPVGEKIVEHARKVLHEAEMLKSVIGEESKTLHGELRLAVIPTLAPVCLPGLLKEFRRRAPSLNLLVEEKTTEAIIEELKQNRIDVGLLVTPLSIPGIKEIPVFYEPMTVFLGKDHPLLASDKVRERDLDRDEVLLLSEGHCFRAQALDLCKRSRVKKESIRFESGSLLTLKNMVNETGGFTLLPELWQRELLSADEKKRLRRFAAPEPVREVSFVYLEPFSRKRALEALTDSLRGSLPKNLVDAGGLRQKTIPLVGFR